MKFLIFVLQLIIIKLSQTFNIFGEFIHHFPYLGLRGEADKANLESSFSETKQLFHDLFGEPIANEESAENSSACQSQGNCWPAKCTSKCNVKRTIDTDRPTFGEDTTGAVDIFAKIFHEELI